MALTDTRRVWVWGDNSEGQLGVPVPTPCLHPVPMQTFPAEATIMYIVAGGEHSLAAVQNVGDIGLHDTQHVWSECEGHGMAAMPVPSLAAGLQEQNDYPKKVCKSFTPHAPHCLCCYCECQMCERLYGCFDAVQLNMYIKSWNNKLVTITPAIRHVVMSAVCTHLCRMFAVRGYVPILVAAEYVEEECTRSIHVPWLHAVHF